MPPYYLLPLLLSVLQFSPPAENEARVGNVEGKPVFINCTPVNEFTRVGSVKPHGSSPDEIAKSAYKKASKTAQNFDALYVNASGDVATAIVFNDAKLTDIATVNSFRGKLIFMRSEPTMPYEIIQAFTFKKKAGDLLKSVPDVAMSKAFKLGVDFDAVIINGRGDGAAIRFKKP